MDNVWMAKHLIDFQKTTFNNTFKTVALLQSHTEKMAETWVGQADWIPEDGRMMMGQWSEMAKKGQNDMISTVNENFDRLADAMSPKK